jgi:hypothetical protein
MQQMKLSFLRITATRTAANPLVLLAVSHGTARSGVTHNAIHHWDSGVIPGVLYGIFSILFGAGSQSDWPGLPPVPEEHLEQAGPAHPGPVNHLPVRQLLLGDCPAHGGSWLSHLHSPWLHTRNHV